ARGQLRLDSRLVTGIEPGDETTPVTMLLQDDEEPATGDPPAGDEPAEDDATPPEPTTGDQADGADTAAPAEGEAPPLPVDNTPWVTEFPEGVKVDMETMERGRE